MISLFRRLRRGVRVRYWPKPEYSDIDWVWDMKSGHRWTVWFRAGPYLVLYRDPP